MDVKEVDIPIFLHPHLFWVFHSKDTLERHQLQCNLAEVYENIVQYNKEFNVGEIVAVKKDNIWYRAIIEDIIEDGSLQYEVWLMDFGYLYYTNLVYKLDKNFKIKPPLVKQASLFNVVFLDEGFSLEKSCIDQFRSPNPNAGASIIALQFLEDFNLFFDKKAEINGIMFGDIYYKKNGLTSSLIKTMVDKELMIEDVELFKKVEESRIYDKGFHIQALRQASKSYKNVRFQIDFSKLVDEVFMKTSARGISLSGSYLESESVKEAEPKLSKKEYLRKLKRRSQSKNIKEASCTESENELSTNKKSSFVEKQSEKIDLVLSTQSEMNKSKTSNSKNLLNRKRQSLDSHKTVNMKNRDLTNLGESDATSKCSSGLKFGTGKEDELCDEAKAVSDVESVTKIDEKSVSDVESLSKTDEKTVSDVESLSKTNENGRLTKNVNYVNKTPPKLLQAKHTQFLPGGIRSMAICSKSSSCSLSDSSLSVDSKRIKRKGNIDDDSVSSTKSEISDTDQQKVEASIEGKKSSLSDPDWNESSEGNSNKQITASAPNLVIKPVCNCKECTHWTTSEDWRMKSEDFSNECKLKELKIEKPLSLMLKGNRKENIKLSTVNYNSMSKLQKQATSKVLVHGPILPVPVERVTEAPFHKAVHNSLKSLGYSRSKKIQNYVWPAITRSMNVCYIHRKKTGKTLAYLPPLCSFILEKEERYDFKKGGPIIVILCSNSAQCEQTYDLATRLMVGARNGKPRMLIVSNPFNRVNLSTIDILITLPTVLIELLKKNATDLKRLCHLVFEDSNILLHKFSEEMRVIIEVVESMLSHRVKKQGVQVILSGEHWTIELENFVKKLRDLPLIAIGDYLEAGLYGRIKLKLKCVELKSKRDTVIGILQNKSKFIKSIVLCNTDDEVDLIKTSLELASISHIAITNNLSKEDILQQESNWELAGGGNYKVLICTDQILYSMLSITSAALIINYSLPEKWTQLTNRFVCLLENFKCPLISDDNKIVCEGYIFSDEFCEIQMPRLISLLTKYNVSLNQFEPYCKQIIIEKELKKISEKISLCKSLKQFGYCHADNCNKRHMLKSDLDLNSSLPKNGTIKFKIIKLVDVNYMHVNIIEYIDIEGKKNDFKSQKYVDDHKLTSILSVKREKPDKICRGESFAYWYSKEFDDVFKECIVEEEDNEKVTIMIQSTGLKTTVFKEELFQIPEELRNDSEKDGYTELIVANLKPPFKDEQFSANAFRKLSHIVDGISYEDNLLVANICLQLGNTLWVTNIKEEISVYEKDLCKTNFINVIKKQQFAEPNPDHLKHLYSLCKDAEIALPNYNVLVERPGVDESQITPQWAFLDTENYNMVYFSCGFSPDEIYVRLAKFDCLLGNLQKDIDDVVKRQGSKVKFAKITGRYYLARDNEENRFFRVFVKHIEDGKALCLSVDYGHEMVVSLEDIRYLSNELIKKLPFQAIQCRLYGLKPIDGEWPTEAVNVLYDNFSLEPDSDIYRTLFAKCVCFDSSLLKGQSKFSILLKDIYEKPIIINQLLVDCGLADIFSNITLDDFEVLIGKQSETSDDEDIFTKEENDDDVRELKDILERTKMVDSNNIGRKYKPPTREEDIDFFFGEPEEELGQFIDFMNELKKDAEERKTRSSRVNNSLPVIMAAPCKVDYCTPDVYWSQNKETVQMLIKLPNVETYDINLNKSRSFKFETTVNNKRYYLHLVLYAMVDKNFTHSLGGLEVKVTLKKSKKLEWPRLSNSEKRLRNVHYLLSNEEMEDEKKKLFLDLGEDLKCESTEDDDGPMYVEVSDVDSEFECDMDYDSDDLLTS